MKKNKLFILSGLVATLLFTGCSNTEVEPTSQSTVTQKKVEKNQNFIILEDIDIGYTKKQTLMFDTMIDYLNNYYYENARVLLIKLVDSSEVVSYVVYYDMGVVEEASGNYKEAERFYSVARRNNVERLKCIEEAYERIYNLNHPSIKNLEAKELILKENNATIDLSLIDSNSTISNTNEINIEGSEICEIIPSGVGVNIREKADYHSAVVGTLNTAKKINIIKEGSTKTWWKLEKSYNNTNAFVNKRVVKILNCSKK